MKFDKRATNLFKIDKEIYIITLCKFITFLSFLFFTYNFIDLLFTILNGNATQSYIISVAFRTIAVLLIYYLSLIVDNKVSHEVSEKIRINLRNEIYNKVQNLSLNYTEAVSTSNLVVMNSNSIQSIELYFNKFIPQVYATILIVLSSLFIFGAINIWLAVAMLVLYPLIPASIEMIRRKSKKQNKKTFSDFLSLSELFFDRLKGFSVAKIYGKEENITAEVDRRSFGYRKSTMDLLKHQLNSINVMDAITYISILVMSLLAIWQLNNPVFVIFVIVASFECFRPLRALGSLFHITMKSSVELDNIYKLLDYEEKAKDNNIKLSSLENIKLSDVTFSYNERSTVLKNVSLKFNKSEKIALVGESGSGKSTIIKLLMGLKKVDSGSATYGEYNLNEIPYDELIKIMTVITSDSYLNADTVYNHLKVNDKITEQDMLDALEKVNLKDFVLENGGLNLRLTEGAGNLSGGQRQRLLSAKAILKDSYIYILDEAVSNIDDYSKKCVLNAFDSIRENKIIIVISHDLEIMENCDKIYVLKDGVVLEEGTHNELVANNKLYSNLLTEQLTLKTKFFEKEVA